MADRSIPIYQGNAGAEDLLRFNQPANEWVLSTDKENPNLIQNSNLIHGQGQLTQAGHNSSYLTSFNPVYWFVNTAHNFYRLSGNAVSAALPFDHIFSVSSVNLATTLIPLFYQNITESSNISYEEIRAKDFIFSCHFTGTLFSGGLELYAFDGVSTVVSSVKFTGGTNVKLTVSFTTNSNASLLRVGVRTTSGAANIQSVSFFKMSLRKGTKQIAWSPDFFTKRMAVIDGEIREEANSFLTQYNFNAFARNSVTTFIYPFRSSANGNIPITSWIQWRFPYANRAWKINTVGRMSNINCVQTGNDGSIRGFYYPTPITYVGGVGNIRSVFAKISRPLSSNAWPIAGIALERVATGRQTLWGFIGENITGGTERVLTQMNAWNSWAATSDLSSTVLQDQAVFGAMRVSNTATDFFYGNSSAVEKTMRFTHGNGNWFNLDRFGFYVADQFAAGTWANYNGSCAFNWLAFGVQF